MEYKLKEEKKNDVKFPAEKEVNHMYFKWILVEGGHRVALVFRFHWIYFLKII